MQTISSVFKKIDGVSLVIGMVFGTAIALVLFSLLVPNGTKMIGMYHNKISYIKAEKNKKEMAKLRDSQEGSSMDHSMHTMSSSDNPYMMSPVTSEKQFLNDMILHHEAAVIMAKEVLMLNNLRPETKTLADAILSAQTKEITDMKAWIKNWGY